MAGRPPLREDEAHVWLAGLAPAEHPPGAVCGWLSRDERDRASRYYRERDRDRFVLGRGILRDLLGRYTVTPPGLIPLGVAEDGKPRLAEPPAGDLEFNLAHSEDLAVYAFARGRRVGVDIEAVRDIPERERIASEHFSAKERAWYETHTGPARGAAFFACWTRKEAVVKAIGRGLGGPLPSFDTSIPAGVPGVWAEFGDGTEEPGRWWVVDLGVPAGYAGALAVERGSELPLRLFRYESAAGRDA
jgi:4'-phosphopantetheinyl transferase